MDEKCYIITYKLSVGVDSATIDDAIMDYGTWAKITSNTWAVVTPRSATQIRDHLQTFIAGGRLFVIKSGLESAWNNVECSNEWLKRNL